MALDDGYRQINEAINDADLVRAAQRGHTIGRERQESETVRMLVESAKEDRQAALNDLANCNPANIRDVTDAQFRYHVANALLVYVDMAIQQGEQARQHYDLRQAPDS